MGRKIAVAALALGLAMPAMAQQAQLVTSFNQTVLTSVLTAIGAKRSEAKTENGKTFYTVTMASGAPAVAYLDECQGQACNALILVTSFPIPQGRTAAQADEMLRNVNNNVPAAKVFRVNDQIVIQAYMLAVGGVTLANVQEQLKTFSNVSLSMYQTLNPRPADS